MLGKLRLVDLRDETTERTTHDTGNRPRGNLYRKVTGRNADRHNLDGHGCNGRRNGMNGMGGTRRNAVEKVNSAVVELRVFEKTTALAEAGLPLGVGERLSLAGLAGCW